MLCFVYFYIIVFVVCSFVGRLLLQASYQLGAWDIASLPFIRFGKAECSASNG